VSQLLYYLFYVTETWNGSFLYTVYNIHAVYTTLVICPHMEGLKTGVDAWSKFTVLTLVYMKVYPKVPGQCS
jgi:hypothetical protein